MARSVPLVLASHSPRPGGLAVQKTISPNPQLSALLVEMIADHLDFAGEEFGLVVAAAARALVLADIEYLIQAGMECVGLESVA